jgi:hypothetical protein
MEEKNFFPLKSQMPQVFMQSDPELKKGISFELLNYYSDPKFIESSQVNSILCGFPDTGMDVGLESSSQDLE